MPARIRHMYQVYTKSYECTANATKTFSLILDSSRFRSENDHFNYTLSYKSRQYSIALSLLIQRTQFNFSQIHSINVGNFLKKLWPFSAFLASFSLRVLHFNLNSFNLCETFRIIRIHIEEVSPKIRGLRIYSYIYLSS